MTPQGNDTQLLEFILSEVKDMRAELNGLRDSLPGTRCADHAANTEAVKRIAESNESLWRTVRSRPSWAVAAIIAGLLSATTYFGGQVISNWQALQTVQERQQNALKRLDVVEVENKDQGQRIAAVEAVTNKKP